MDSISSYKDTLTRIIIQNHTKESFFEIDCNKEMIQVEFN